MNHRFPLRFFATLRQWFLLFRLLQIQRQQPFQNLFVAQIVWPAVGGEDRGVELFVRIIEPIEKERFIEEVYQNVPCSAMRLIE